MSYFSQMVGLAFHNFVSAAVGIAVAAALVRGIARHKSRTIGNFWVDLIRINLYLLLPICLVYSVFLVSQGMIQNFKPYDTAQLIAPYSAQVAKKDADGQEVKDAQGNPVTEELKVETQTIPQGPMASQVAIKMLGTNGGGFVNANAAHPFENPDASVQLSANVVHFLDTKRAHVLSRPNGEEPAPRMGSMGSHGDDLSHRFHDLLVG